MSQRPISDLERRAVEYIRAELPSLESHLAATRDLALEINRDQKLGVDPEKMALAALCHDLARLLPPAEMASELRRRGIDPESLGCAVPVLLHGVLSAELAKEEIGITDEEILNAIRMHATGSGEMSLLDKLIYVADKVEKNRQYEGADELRETVRKDFHRGFLDVVSAVIRWVVVQSQPLDYNSVAAYNTALEEFKAAKGRGG